MQKVDSKMNDDFDFGNIPDFVLHDAVRETLGSCQLTGGTNGTNYNFRCPICGDSKTRQHLKRGFILTNRDCWVYHCHNECGSMPFTLFLKENHPDVYRRVMFHALKERAKPNLRITKKKVVEKNTKYLATEYKFKEGELLSILDSHPLAILALETCKKRHIPETVYKTWFVCVRDDYFFDKDEFGDFIYDDKGNPTGNDYGNRLIIPYYKLGGKWSQFDARALHDYMMIRYKNLKNCERELYKIDWLDTSKPFFLLEGAIDSSFIKNSVAFGGTKHLHRYLEQYHQLLNNSHNGTIIWDNDDAGIYELFSNLNLQFNYFDWKLIEVKEEFKFNTDGTQRKIKDINDFVLYSKQCVLDNKGYINIDCLMSFIKSNEGSRVRLIQQYGDRIAMKKQEIFNKKQLNIKKSADISAF